MIKIIKQREPNQWKERCSTPGATFEAVPELITSLLEEQGYICAYCTRRIPQRDTNSNEKHRIEHIKCQERYPEHQLRYSNIVICCPGAIDNDYHCDKKKGNSDITFALFTDTFFETLGYSTFDGRIRTSNPSWNNEINSILNLNNKLLMKNRKEALDGVINMMGRDKWTVGDKRHHINIWENKDISGKYKAYCGIILWFLRKNLTRP